MKLLKVTIIRGCAKNFLIMQCRAAVHKNRFEKGDIVLARLGNYSVQMPGKVIAVHSRPSKQGGRAYNVYQINHYYPRAFSYCTKSFLKPFTACTKYEFINGINELSDFDKKYIGVAMQRADADLSKQEQRKEEKARRSEARERGIALASKNQRRGQKRVRDVSLIESQNRKKFEDEIEDLRAQFFGENDAVITLKKYEKGLKFLQEMTQKQLKKYFYILTELWKQKGIQKQQCDIKKEKLMKMENQNKSAAVIDNEDKQFYSRLKQLLNTPDWLMNQMQRAMSDEARLADIKKDILYSRPEENWSQQDDYSEKLLLNCEEYKRFKDVLWCCDRIDELPSKVAVPTKYTQQEKKILEYAIDHSTLIRRLKKDPSKVNKKVLISFVEQALRRLDTKVFQTKFKNRQENQHDSQLFQLIRLALEIGQITIEELSRSRIIHNTIDFLRQFQYSLGIQDSSWAVRVYVYLKGWFNYWLIAYESLCNKHGVPFDLMQRNLDKLRSFKRD